MSITEVLSSMGLLISAGLIMLMIVGFAFLEAGAVSRKSVAAILTKNVAALAVTTMSFYLLGHQIMFGIADGDFFSAYQIWGDSDQPSGGLVQPAYWLFVSLFAVSSTSIVSGAVAERMRINAFLIFAAFNGALVFPLIGHWVRGGGWLQQNGFHDFAGATVVHTAGGLAALIGSLILGPRLNRFDHPGAKLQTTPSSLPLATLGVFLLWIGWFGFNGGSALPVEDLNGFADIPRIVAFTNSGAVGGVLFACVYSRLILRRWDLVIILNGALAGLVAITAAPHSQHAYLGFVFGALGAAIMIATDRLLLRLKIDDAVGAVPVHLGPGLFSAIVVVSFANDASWEVQVYGAAAICLFVVFANLILWGGLNMFTQIRLNPSEEIQGGDLAEVGHAAYDLIDPDMKNFSYIATHDLKEPLRTIHSFSQLAEKTKDQEECRQYLTRIRDASVKMRSLIDDLIVYSSLNHVANHSQPVDSGELVFSIFSDLEKRSEGKGDYNLDADGLPVIACNSTLLTHVFQNLIQNAMNYRHPDRALQLAISVTEKPSVHEFAVSDNGLGIPQNNREAVFDVFSRFHPETKQAGNGVGLAIVRKAVYRMGGVIWIQTKLGSGTTFYFTIPKDPSPAPKERFHEQQL
ncbi:MAG: ATP-binding protein [Roseibium sp.]|uniref:ATP-binding protein n=1 Tax=Roseibium sp. TaxID=1936156 RepID=UPI003D9C202E